MGIPLNVLVVEDSEDDTLLMIRELEGGGYIPEHQRVETAEAMGAALREKTWDLVLCDYKLPKFNGLQALNLFKETGTDIPFILVSGTIGEELAVEAMKNGAHDYLMKDKIQRLVPAVQRELREAAVRQERQKAEESLREFAQRWQTTFDAINDSVCILDLNGKILECNLATTRLLNKPIAEILGDHCFKLVHHISVPFERCPIVRMQTSGQRESTSLQLGDRWVDVTVDPLFDASGRLIGAVHIISDITEDKQREEALRESEERYRDMVENINDILYVCDINGNITYISPPVESLLGYRPSEIIGRNFREFVHPEDLHFISEGYQKIVSGQVEPHEYRFIKKSGEICWIRFSSFRIVQGEKIVGLRGILTDVTKRVQAEEERQQTLNNLRKAMGGIIEAMATTVETRDPYTAGHQRRVADLARAIAQEVGLSKDRTEGIHMAGIVHDLGKISIPAEILSKPTRLTDLEFALIKAHPEVSYDILKNIDFPWPVALIVLQHHERINGSGYPQGLTVEEILFEARILAVADVVEAIASHRPYRPAHGIEVALKEIEEKKGVLYDPVAVEACLRLFKEKGFVLE